MNKYGWAAIGALAILGWPYIGFVFLATLSRSFEALSEVTRPNPIGVTATTTTTQQPMSTDQLYEKLSRDRKEDKERQGRRDDRQDETIRDIRTSVEDLGARIDNLTRHVQPTPPSNSERRGRWLCTDRPCTRPD